MTVSAAQISCLALAISLAGGRAESQPGAELDSGKAGFSLVYRGETSPYRVNGLFMLPGEEVIIEALAEHLRDEFEATADRGTLRKISARRWAWEAPKEAGVYSLEVERVGTQDRIVVNACVLVPFENIEDGRLNGYRIGAYPRVPLRGLSIYRPPKGFVEVTRENENTLISPHFRLKQFLCKQAGDYPKYVVLRERLLLKLELILETVNAKGFRADTLHIMSGYRTPFYNKAIQNVEYSRHVWGGAADVFVDANPRDGVMDDLNRDGELDVRDTGVLRDWVEELYGKAFYEPFIGGLASYRSTPAHGPFLHVDVRGTRARWGR